MSLRHVHTLRMAIRWGDMDVLGHVNNTVYFRYFESARLAWFDEVGASTDPSGEGPVIINASCTFLKQLKYPGDIEVKTFAGAPGRSSFEMQYEIRLVGDDTLYATGASKVVWINYAQEKSAPVPDFLRAQLPTA